MLLLNVYYATINLSCYCAAVMLLFKVYYCLLGTRCSSVSKYFNRKYEQMISLIIVRFYKSGISRLEVIVAYTLRRFSALLTFSEVAHVCGWVVRTDVRVCGGVTNRCVKLLTSGPRDVPVFGGQLDSHVGLRVVAR